MLLSKRHRQIILDFVVARNKTIVQVLNDINRILKTKMVERTFSKKILLKKVIIWLPYTICGG